jgi:lambda family phage portal protein
MPTNAPALVAHEQADRPTFYDARRVAEKRSVVLTKWLQQRPGALERAALVPVRPLPLGGKGQRSYAAAQVNRLTQGWSTVSGSANADIHASLDAVRARSRQLARDNEYIHKWLNLLVTNVVGPDGFRLQARVYDRPGVSDDGANESIEAAWKRYGRKGVADVTGRQTLASFLQTAIKTVATDGDLIIQIVRGAAAANPFGVAFRIIDADRIETRLNRSADGTNNAIRMGVEVNAYGRAVAYHVRNTHPGDLFHTTGAQGMQTLRIPAEDIIHEFISDRPEQVRGIPWAHAAMSRLNSIGAYEEAALVASRTGASQMGFFTTTSGDMTELASSTGDGEQSADGSGDGGPLYMEAEAGTFHGLPAGTDFKPFNPNYPQAMFEPFIKANLRAACSGLLAAYHSIGNNLEGVSFSSIRSGTLEDRDHWMILQSWFAESVLDRIFDEWLGSALAFGQITGPAGNALPLAKIEKFRPHKWQGRRWEWVDPRADIDADLSAIEAGLKSPQQVAAKLGMDYEDLLIEIEQAKAMRQRKGLAFVAQDGPRNAPQAPMEPAAAAVAAPA